MLLALPWYSQISAISGIDMRSLHLTLLATFALDQISKWFVVHAMNLRQMHEIDVFSPYLNLRMAWNYGVNFGLFAQSNALTKWLLIAVALAICVAVYLWVKKERPRKIALISAGLLIGGALGNVIDRVLYGAVADFLNMSCCGLENPYSFNIADVAVFAGAIGLALFTGQTPARRNAP